MLLFIGWPIFAELFQWWKRKSVMRWNWNTMLTVFLIVGLLGMVLVPWQFRIAIPAVLRAKEFTLLFPPAPARLDRILVKPGEFVTKGTPLMTFSRPELNFQLSQAEERIELLVKVIKRYAATAKTDNRLQVMREELATTLSMAQGLRQLQAMLTIKTPFSGMMVE